VSLLCLLALLAGYPHVSPLQPISLSSCHPLDPPLLQLTMPCLPSWLFPACCPPASPLPCPHSCPGQLLALSSLCCCCCSHSSAAIVHPAPPVSGAPVLLLSLQGCAKDMGSELSQGWVRGQGRAGGGGGGKGYGRRRPRRDSTLMFSDVFDVVLGSILRL
jgi:hypothetical protein